MNSEQQSGLSVAGAFIYPYEADLAKAYGLGHVVGCGSGTDALLLALLALGIGPGDRVLCPA